MNDNLRELIKSILTEEEIKRDIDSEGSGIRPIPKLGPNSTNVEIINKINELINSFNKTLRDYRV